MHNLKMILIGVPFVAGLFGVVAAGIVFFGPASALVVPVIGASWVAGKVVSEIWNCRK